MEHHTRGERDNFGMSYGIKMTKIVTLKFDFFPL